MAINQTVKAHLVSCVGVDTEYAHLPHFIDHYLALGIPPARFHVILNTQDAQSENLAAAQALLQQRGLPAPDLCITPYTSDSMWAKRREVQARDVPLEDWVISADVDEFHEYPEDLPDFLAAMEARGVDCVQGVLIDRLAADGALAAVDSDTSIWETFPLQADVQCAIGGTGENYNWYGTVKAMALKGTLSPSRGGHHPVEADKDVHYLFGRHLAQFAGIGHASFRFFVPLRVHHFKWVSSMPAALRERLATPGVSAADVEYGGKLLDYFDRNGGVRLQDVTQRRSNAPGCRGWRRRVAYLRALDNANEASKKLRSLPGRVFRNLAR